MVVGNNLTLSYSFGGNACWSWTLCGLQYTFGSSNYVVLFLSMVNCDADFAIYTQVLHL